jgi:hypothetical protein
VTEPTTVIELLFYVGPADWRSTLFRILTLSRMSSVGIRFPYDGAFYTATPTSGTHCVFRRMISPLEWRIVPVRITPTAARYAREFLDGELGAGYTQNGRFRAALGMKPDYREERWHDSALVWRAIQVGASHAPIWPLPGISDAWAMTPSRIYDYAATSAPRVCRSRGPVKDINIVLLLLGLAVSAILLLSLDLMR